jgi:hypothetical protein
MITQDPSSAFPPALETSWQSKAAKVLLLLSAGFITGFVILLSLNLI